MSAKDTDFTPAEFKELRRLKTPAKVQDHLDRMKYHLADTAWSPRYVLEGRTAHCLEGALFAAAALRVNGYPPLILDLEADRDTDHVIAVFKENGAWGAVAMSNYAGCRFRAAVYRDLRELAMSYFEDYFSPRGERTLRRYSRPVNLSRFDPMNWMTTRKPLWPIAEYLVDIPHLKLLTPAQERALPRIDERSVKSAFVGYRHG